jgi:hypothetical protein
MTRGSARAVAFLGHCRTAARRLGWQSPCGRATAFIKPVARPAPESLICGRAFARLEASNRDGASVSNWNQARTDRLAGGHSLDCQAGRRLGNPRRAATRQRGQRRGYSFFQQKTSQHSQIVQYSTAGLHMLLEFLQIV